MQELQVERRWTDAGRFVWEDSGCREALVFAFSRLKWQDLAGGREAQLPPRAIEAIRSAVKAIGGCPVMAVAARGSGFGAVYGFRTRTEDGARITAYMLDVGEGVASVAMDIYREPTAPA